MVQQKWQLGIRLEKIFNELNNTFFISDDNLNLIRIRTSLSEKTLGILEPYFYNKLYDARASCLVENSTVCRN